MLTAFVGTHDLIMEESRSRRFDAFFCSPEVGKLRDLVLYVLTFRKRLLGCPSKTNTS